MSETLITKVEAIAETNTIPHSVQIVKIAMCPEQVPAIPTGSCHYYDYRNTNFLQRHSGKTPPEYYLKYGLYYCQLFKKKTYPDLSPKGRVWLNRTLDLLQEYIEKGIVDRAFVSEQNKKFNADYYLENIIDPVTKKVIGVTEKTKEFYKGIECRAENYTKNHFKDFAFATHPDAYRPDAMQKLPIEDLIQIAWTPDLKEWFDGRTWEQALIMYDKMDVSQITTNTADRLSDGIEESVDKAVQELKEVFK